MTRVTLQEIADHLGISKFAVSRALAGKPGVSEDTRRSVLSVAEQFGYIARRNRTPPQSIEVIFHDRTIANRELWIDVQHGIEMEAAQRPADERLAEALAPLRLKLDIVIEMLGRLTYRDVTLPAVRDIELGMDRIAWHSPRPLGVGEWLRLKLYFDPNFLEPVVLYARVASAISEDDGGCSVQAELAETSLETEEAVPLVAQRGQRGQRALPLPGVVREPATLEGEPGDPDGQLGSQRQGPRRRPRARAAGGQ